MTLALLLLAAFSMQTALVLLIKIVVAGLIAYVLFWALGKIGLPEPFAKVALVVIVLVVAFYVISLLLEFA